LTRQLSRVWVLPLIFLAALLTGIQTASAESRPMRLLILPFQIHSQNNLDFLKDGMFDMLASRLTFSGELVVTQRNQTESALQPDERDINPNEAEKAGQRLQADYVLWGSLTEFGESLSMDVNLIDMGATKAPMSFFGQSASMDDVIPTVSRLAAQINKKAFGRETYVEEAYQEKTPAAFDIHANPEKLIEKGLID